VQHPRRAAEPLNYAHVPRGDDNYGARHELVGDKEAQDEDEDRDGVHGGHDFDTICLTWVCGPGFFKKKFV
jgi:hypothetical protein